MDNFLGWAERVDLAVMDGRDSRLVVASDFSEEDRRRFLLRISAGAGIGQAARDVGVTLRKVQEASGGDPAFREALELAERDKWSLAEDKLYKAVENEEPWAIKMALKESDAFRAHWKPAAERSEIVADVGPGIERLLELQERLARRRGALVVETTGSEL